MIINDLFQKSIDRDLDPVVKTGEISQEKIAYDLDEYVVTNELASHLTNFYLNYAGINSTSTEKIGVWIKGYYGCGKSYFLKILSYLLENPSVNGESAVSLFTKGDKIKDNELRSLIQKAGHIPAKVVSFDITTRGTASMPVLDVLTSELNRLEGFCTKFPYMAEIERTLCKNGTYDKFKAAFTEVSNGKSWENEREFGPLRNKLAAEALSKVDGGDFDSALSYFKEAKSNIKMTAELFAQHVKRYCESQGKEFRLIFLIDELGPYIADKDDEITSLQAIVVSLATVCKGKAWIAVTTLEDYNNKSKVLSADLSRIQARFDTRIALSSANVEEIIRERLLKKEDNSKEMLKLTFDSEETSIKNLLQFSDEAFKDFYKNETDFANTYPFAKYQFSLAQSTMQQAFESGATSGDNLSQGERSLLRLFSFAVNSIKDKLVEINGSADKSTLPLVPYDAFYFGLQSYLSASYSGIISHANDNGHLNDFDVRVLKVLLMIKNIPQITATVENIATLVIDNLDTDRNQLEKDVKRSLDRLVLEKLISKNGSVYIFLSNEEREVDSYIDKETVEEGEIIQEIKGVIFEDILAKIKTAISPDNRYQFGFNPFIDDIPVRRGSNEELTLKIITELKGKEWDEDKCCTVTRAESNQKMLLIKLNAYEAYTPEIRRRLQITKYVAKKMNSQSNSDPSLERIKAMRSAESNEIRDRYSLFIKQALEDADFYVGGEALKLASGSAESKVREALSHLVEVSYSKLSYMSSEVTSGEVLQVLSGGKQSLIDGTRKNENAINEISKVIKRNVTPDSRISLRNVIDIFSKIPYGYCRIDVAWLVAVLFNDSKISLKYHGKRVTYDNTTPEDIAKYLTYTKNVDYPDALIIEVREEASKVLVEGLRDILQNVFGVSTSVDDKEDVLISRYVEYAESLMNEFEKYLGEYTTCSLYPGKRELEDSVEMLRDTLTLAEGVQYQFFKEIGEKADELESAVKKGKQVSDFFSSSKRAHFDRAVRATQKYSRDSVYLTNPVCGELIEKLSAIIQMPAPYGAIKQIPIIAGEFEAAYSDVLSQKKQEVDSSIASDLQDVIANYDVLKLDSINEKYKAEQEFGALRNGVKTSEEISDVISFGPKSNTLKGSWMKKWADLAKKAVSSSVSGADVCEGAGDQKVITVQIRTLMKGSSFYLKSEDEVDDFVEIIRANLMAELKKGDAVQIQ